MFEELGEDYVARAQSVARTQSEPAYEGPWKDQSVGVMEATVRLKQGIGILRCVFYKDH